MSITLKNTTPYTAQFIIQKGQQFIAHLPGLEPGGILSVPTDDSYEVIATTVYKGKTYTSAPQQVVENPHFLAQMLQSNNGSYDFKVVTSLSSRENEITFEKTTLNHVTFTITKDAEPIQDVVVATSFKAASLHTGSTFNIFAVINGITTATLATTDASAVITALAEESTAFSEGYFQLVIENEGNHCG